MAKLELTIEQAKKQSANFLYMFADKKYLSYLNPKYAVIIAGKRANQQSILMRSAQHFLNDPERYTEYLTAIAAGFKDDYGMTPQEALVKLALGETVAGKNYGVGMFGIGATKNTNTFAGITMNDKAVTVDPTTGHIFIGVKDITDTSKTVYAEIGKKTIAYQLFSTEQGFGTIFQSQYNKTLRKYYAECWSDDEGKQHRASTGNVIGTSDTADMWGNIQMAIPAFQELINWILSLFGITSSTNNTEMINSTNTLPNQTTDGYVQQAGLSEAGMIALLAVGAGAMIFGGVGKKKSN